MGDHFHFVWILLLEEACIGDLVEPGSKLGKYPVSERNTRISISRIILE